MHRQLLALGLAGVLAGCGSLSKPIPNIEYTCDDGTLLSVEAGNSQGRITRGDGKTFVLPRQISASGFVYSSGRYELSGDDKQAIWASDTRRPARCTAK